MSSTKRGGKRSPADFYATPHWTTDRLLDELGPDRLPGGRWLEPCAGDGAIMQTISKRRSDVVWSAAELREEMRPILEPISPGGLYIGDTLTMPNDYFGDEKFEVFLTNPPFSLGYEMIRKGMEMAKLTVMLLRLNFWGSEERRAFLEAFPPDTYVIPNRPAFCLNKHGRPATDSIEYCWAVWQSEEHYATGGNLAGKIKVLKSTPKAERAEWTKRLKREADAAIKQAITTEPYLEAGVV